MSKRIIYDYLSDDELLRISNKIKEAEKKTRAEILVTIKEKRNLLEIRKPIRQLAEIEFQRSGITKTKDRTGVLIFILLSDKQFYILADSAISNIISQKTFDDIAEKMSDTFRKGNFLSGIINCISSLSEILGRYFPVLPDDVNEISNRVRFS
ncbi:MAG: TPM domain-containing protein [Ignavibacterium album]|uniref:TPM domain-containing protein n=1 Tax=Ignavibacterium album TaxID=591197 RepID=UPI0026F368E6|nr:TPM domain-containing protein [Ignavibacterium album]MBI5661865.1 TPM domain-containing protein [Ignavibacterium album]